MSAENESTIEFKLPIEFNEKKRPLSKSIQEDLEMVVYKENPSENLYYTLTKPQSDFGKETLELWRKYYTTDTNFIEDSQKLIKDFKSITPIDCDELAKIKTHWEDIRGHSGFKDTYQYVDWERFEYLNRNASFLQFMSVYNLISPVLSVVLPIFLMIVPFFLLKLQGVHVSFSKYFETLKRMIRYLPIGKLLQMEGMSWSGRVYTLMTVGLYFFQIYQNAMLCYKFHKNMRKMHEYLIDFRNYILQTQDLMDKFLSSFTPLETFKPFLNTIQQTKTHLRDLQIDLDAISTYNLHPKRVLEIGHGMKLFYKFHCDPHLGNIMRYTFGFNGFIENVCGIHETSLKFLKPCKLSSKNFRMKGIFFAPLKESNPVRNDVSLRKNMIITGPNASGKTTLLKSVLFNQILSQQIGHGFFDEASIIPFHQLHCYLNIPDTSSRDSLFQAEARRCKEIIDAIQNDKERHFCIFDELYSGTNPCEAMDSATAYLNYLCSKEHLKFMLTTHYTGVCENVKEAKNHRMKVDTQNDEFNYTYCLEKGISDVKGAKKVLKELNYPEEIINTLNN